MSLHWLPGVRSWDMILIGTGRSHHHGHIPRCMQPRICWWRWILTKYVYANIRIHLIFLETTIIFMSLIHFAAD